MKTDLFDDHNYEAFRNINSPALTVNELIQYIVEFDWALKKHMIEKIKFPLNKISYKPKHAIIRHYGGIDFITSAPFYICGFEKEYSHYEISNNFSSYEDFIFNGYYENGKDIKEIYMQYRDMI